MRLKQLVILIIATLCCTTALAGTTAAVVEKHYNDSIREGQTYLFYDYFVTEPGTYNNLLHGVGGHDDLLVYLHLNVLPPCTDIEVSYTDSIVLGESYLLANKIITPTEVGTLHEQTIIARASGCDSTINLTLKVKAPCSDITVAYTDSIVLGETYLFIDQFITPTEVGTVTASATIPRVAGCDSTINLTLKVLEPCSDITVAYTDSIVLGETYLFIDQFITPTEVGTVNASATIPRVAGCDSTINLTLKVLEPCSDITVAYTDSIVLGETYLFIDQFITPTEVGTVTASATIPRVAGCDSTINLTLKVLEPCSDITVAYTDSIVLGETYLFIDQFITPTEVGTVNASATIPRVAGCDSTINLTLKVLEPCSDITVAYTDSIVLGETYLFIDQFITPTEVGTVTASAIIPRVAGCDSTINLTLKVLPDCEDVEVAYTDSIYLGETYLFVDQMITPTVAGTTNHQAILPREGCSCDSIINLTLIAMRVQERDTLRDTIKVNRCYKEAFTDRLGVTYHPTQDTVVLDTLPAARFDTTDTKIVTIDSIYRYELKVWKAAIDSLKKDTILVDLLPYTWQVYEGRTLSCDTAGTYRDTLDNILGCDSIHFILKLEVIAHDTAYKAIHKNLCNGEYYKTRLQEITPVTVGDTAFNDTVPGIMMEPLLMRDSIYQYTFTVWPAAVDSTLKDTILEDNLPYKWKPVAEEHQYYVAGTYHDTADNILGCDSVHYTLELKVIEHDTIEVIVPASNLCDGDVYKSRLQELTMVGHEDNVFDTTFNDTIKSQMVEPLQMNDTIYKYHLYVWPKTKYPEAFKDTIDDDKWPYIWNVYVKDDGDTVKEIIPEGAHYFHHRKNILDCDSIVYELQLTVRTVERREAALIEDYVCKGTEYHGRLTNHVINNLTEWQDSLRIWDNDLLLAIDSIYTYKIDTLPTKIPDDQITGIKAFCDYPVDYSYAWLNVAEFVNPYFIFAEVTDTIWEVETKNGWNPAATTILTSEDKTIRVRCTVVTECETTYSTSEPYEVKMATADDKEELTIPAAQKYGSRIIMIDKKATEDLGWTIPEADVTWYQVVDEPDDRSYDSNPATWNDKKVGEGQYYYTLDNGDPIIGQYYAIVTGATKGEKMTCGAELRTPVLVCNQKSNAPTLAPNLVAPNESMTLSGLDATQNYTIRVISMDGSTVNNFSVSANERVDLKAASVQGMYIVNVWNGQENVSLKYIVK